MCRTNKLYARPYRGVSIISKQTIGRIVEVYFGVGGFADNAIGLHITIELPQATQQISYAYWNNPRITTEEEWSKTVNNYASVIFRISGILEKTGIDDVSDLLGRTVTATINEKGRITDVDF